MAALSNSLISINPTHDYGLTKSKSRSISPVIDLVRLQISSVNLTAHPNTPLANSLSDSSGSSMKSFDQSTKLLFGQSQMGNVQSHTSKRALSVRAGYSERSSSGNAFVGGFVLGGLIVGTLGCVYAPQISKALAGADKKELLRKLPAFIYDEEKALEKTRKKLTEKIAQLNDAIDDVSSQLKSDDENSNENGAIVSETSQTVA